MYNSQYFLTNKLSAYLTGLTILAEHLSKVDNIEKVFSSSKCIKNYTFFVPISVRKMSFPTLLILSSLLFKILGYEGQSVFKDVHYIYELSLWPLTLACTYKIIRLSVCLVCS